MELVIRLFFAYDCHVYQEDWCELNDYGTQKNDVHRQRDRSAERTRDHVATQYMFNPVPSSQERKQVTFLKSSRRGTPRSKSPSGRII